MKSFSKFCKENLCEDKRYETKSENISKENAKEKIQETYNTLKDLNSDELATKLHEEVKKQKENGTFDFNGLCDSVERMRAFIPKETYENMKNLLGKLND